MFSVLLVAAAMLGSCKSNQQVGVLTKPTSATSNLEGHEFPKINPDLSATFRNDFPDAKTVTVNVGGKNYPLVKGEDGLWEVTTDPLVVGFHYYTMNVDGKRISDPNSNSSTAQACGRAELRSPRPVWIIIWRRRSRTAR